MDRIMTHPNDTVQKILNRLVSATYLVDNDGAHITQHLITPEMLAEAQAAIEALIAEAVREARKGGFIGALAGCSFNTECKNCEANRLTLRYFVNPEGTRYYADKKLQAREEKRK
jgi:hypothetical protein